MDSIAIQSRYIMTSFSHPCPIVFVLLIPLPYAGAAWTRVEFFANHLRKFGYDVSIAGAFSPKTINKFGSSELDGIRIHNLIPIIILTNFLAQIFNITSSLVVCFFLFLVKRPKIVVISVPSSANALGCYLIAYLLRIVVITDYRDEWEDFAYQLSEGYISKKLIRINKKAMTICYRNSSAVMAVTKPVAEALRSRGIKNIVVVPNGADTKIFRPKEKLKCRAAIGIPLDCFVLFYIGHLGSYYKLDTVLHALKDFVSRYDSKTLLIIVGHGIGLQPILKLAEDCGIRQNIMYLGKILNKERLVDAICASDVGIVPHDTKAFSRNAMPVKSLEYLACGIPVVAITYSDSQLGKMIMENKVGLIVEPGDLNSICEAINKMRTDEILRDSCLTRGLSFVRENYDRCKIAEEFVSLIKIPRQ